MRSRVRQLVTSAKLHNKQKVKCLICHESKYLIEFHRDRRRPTGYRPYCKSCRCLEETARRAKSPKLTKRRCRLCHKVLPRRSFSSEYTSACRECMEPNKRTKRIINQRRRRYLRHRKIILVANKTRYQRRYPALRLSYYEKKTQVASMLGGRCSQCTRKVSKRWPIQCFDFHHIGVKKVEVSTLLRRCSRPDDPRVLREIKQCVLLCALCHRKTYSN